MNFPNLNSVLNSDDDDSTITSYVHSQGRTEVETERAGFPLTGKDAFSDNGSHSSHIDRGSSSVQSEILEEKNEKKDEIVTWRSLPHKGQLIVLTLARLSEPLVQTSIQSYMFYMLKSFDKSLPDSVISRQAGLMQGSFTGAQFLTAMMWGKIADSDRGGRKMVLMIGLLGTMISCVGFGFSTSFYQAIICRTIGGALNGNVGVMRTMISEIIKEKKYQSRAFLLLPMCFNIGVIIGPVLGGLLADPAGSYPGIFGNIGWLVKFPYAPPNLMSAVVLLVASTLVFLGLEETLESIRHKGDVGTKIGRKLAEMFRRLRGKSHSSDHAYAPVAGDDTPMQYQEDVEMSPVSPAFLQSNMKKVVPRYRQKLPFRRIFTRNVISTLIAHGLLACHLGTFNNLWFVFLSTPVADPAHPNPPSYQRRIPFIFTGGLGMPPRDVGFAMAILGIIGITMQLFVYPTVNAKLGVVRSWRIFLYCFPVSYALAPYLAIVPSRSPPPAEKDGVVLYLALCGILFIQVMGRTFALPATTILINNCSPHPSVLGTIHGIGQSVSSGMRTVGPVLGGFSYGLGLSHGIVGAVWWGLSSVAICGCIASYWVKEGDGHEIKLEGDDEDEGD
jgi:MFS family permease